MFFSARSSFLYHIFFIFIFCTSDFRTKFGFDTADNEPFQVCPLSSYRSSRYILEMQSPQGRYELTNRTLLEMNEEQQRSFKSTVERIRGNLSVQRHRSC